MKTRTISLILGLFLFSVPARAATMWYASTNGTNTAAGTIGDPWDLFHALKKTTNIVAGDTLNVRGGRYSNTGLGAFVITIQGTTANPITVRSYPGEWAVLDGVLGTGVILAVNGTNAIVRDIEIWCSSTESRYSAYNSSFPPDILRPSGVDFNKTGGKGINLVVHDTSNGISVWDDALEVEVYGCVVYNNGYYIPTRGGGHNFYAQHAYTGSTNAVFKRNISIAPYDNHIQMYGSSEATIARFRFLENFVVGEHDMILGTKTGGAADRVRDNQITDNFGWNAPLRLFYQPDAAAYKDLLCAGNYFTKTLVEISSWSEATITNNTFFWVPTAGKVISLTTNATFPSWNSDRNTFVLDGGSSSSAAFDLEGIGNFTLAAWRTKTGYESNSVIVTSLPSTNYVIVQDNAYSTNLAHCAVYNWTLASFVAVNMTAFGWGPGAIVKVRNVHDYFVDSVNTVMTATNTLVLDMRATAHSVSIPPGDTTSPQGKTFPDFGAFTFELISAAAPDTNAPLVTITSPSTGTTYTNAQSVTFQVTASDDVGVNRVEFYDGTTLHLTDTSAPFNDSWTVQYSQNGTYNWTARAYDTSGNTTTSTNVSLIVNIPAPDTNAPSVSITSPSEGTTFSTEQTVILQAVASDNVGVTSVEFLDGTTLRAIVTNAPYNFNWTIAMSDNGTHVWTARAYDAATNNLTSVALHLIVDILAVTDTIPSVPSVPSSISDTMRRRGLELQSKGDLLTHNGTASDRLAVGVDSWFPVADSTAALGIRWTNTLVAMNLKGTLTPPGTTNVQTINKACGRINLGIPSTTTFLITNSLVTTNSLVFANLATVDATARLKNVVAATGLITITLDVTNTSECKLAWLMVNPQ